MLAEDIDLKELTEELAAMRKELQLLRDKEEIRDVIYRYAFCADLECYDEFLDLLTDDVVWTASGSFTPGLPLPPEGVFKGKQECLAAVSGPGHAGIANKEQHIMANLIIDVDGDSAVAIGQLVLTLHNWGGFSIGTCRYIKMDFVRDGGWKMSAMTFRETGDAEHGKFITETGMHAAA